MGYICSVITNEKRLIKSNDFGLQACSIFSEIVSNFFNVSYEERDVIVSEVNGLRTARTVGVKYQKIFLYGSSKNVLNRCSTRRIGRSVVKLSESTKEKILRKSQEYVQKGYRTGCFATKKIKPQNPISIKVA